MDEKRKPYATITIRKPRTSLLLSAILIAAIVAVAAGSILQERDAQAAQLSALQDSVETAQAGLQQSQAELAAANATLLDYRQQFADPLSYYDYSEGQGKWLRLFACSDIVLDSLTRGVSGGTIVAYNVLDRKANAHLKRRDDYSLVGEYDWAPGGEKMETIYFYMRQDVLTQGAFNWPDSNEWSVLHRNWEDYLIEHCQRL